MSSLGVLPERREQLESPARHVHRHPHRNGRQPGGDEYQRRDLAGAARRLAGGCGACVGTAPLLGAPQLWQWPWERHGARRRGLRDLAMASHEPFMHWFMY